MLTKSKFSYDAQISNKICLILGIGGVSMSSIALLLQDMGYTVQGYDRSHGQYTDLVEKCGIPVVYGDDIPALDNVGLIVYTAAIKPNHPILMLAEKKGVPSVVRAKFLGELMLCYKNRVGICGTHGKSTTSGMISQILLMANTDPTVMIGADLPLINSGLNIGSEEMFVFEACEYQDSFLSFFPTISVVLNVELDHTDYFLSLDQMKASYSKFIEASEYSVVSMDSENAVDCVRGYKGKLTYFSTRDENADLYAKNIIQKRGKAEFDAYYKGEFFHHFALNVPGVFQVSNTLAAIGVSILLGIDREDISNALLTFGGVGRRFQFRKSLNGADIYDDYAHHPDEIKATLSAAKEMTDGRVIAVYQPHTYTRTNDFFKEFTLSFDHCDEVIFADIYAAREKNTCGISSKNLADATKNGKYLGGFDEISKYVRDTVKKDDLVIIMGAGDIINLEI